MEPTFKNKTNKLHIVKDEFNNSKQIWESRSVAVIGIIFGLRDNKLFILAEKRSDTMMDAPGKWCLPCGYLDWDETGWEAIKREIFEETTLNLDDYKEHIVEDNNQQPFFVNTSPSENRQNIALSYCIVFDFPYDEFPEHLEKHAGDEVAVVKWIPYEKRNNYAWAFSHGSRINMALEHILKD